MRALGYIAPVADGTMSLLEQRRAFNVYCLEEGHRVVALYAESPHGDTGQRSAYDQLRDEVAAAGKAFLVVIANAMVLGGSLSEVVRRVLELDALGCKVVCSGRAFPDPIQDALRRFQSSHARRVRKAMAVRAMDGDGLGRPPFGYCLSREGRFEVQPEEARVVERIFQLYVDEGLGIRRATQVLNREGLTTRTGRPWSGASVLDVLRNPVYIGTYRRLGFRVPGNHQALVPPATFRKAQDLLESRRRYRRTARTESYLLSGLAACGACGSRVIGVTRRQAWRNKDGRLRKGLYRYYQCHARANQGACEYQTRRADELEEQVLERVRGHLNTWPVEALDAPVGPADREDADTLKRTLEQGWTRAVRQAAEGRISLAHLRDIVAGLDARASRLDDGLTGALRVRDVLDRERWQGMEVEDRQLLLKCVIEQVLVEKNSCAISFHGRHHALTRTGLAATMEDGVGGPDGRSGDVITGEESPNSSGQGAG